MKKVCIVFYQHIVREYDACRRICENIEGLSKGLIEAKAFSLDFEWTKAWKYATKAEPVAILLPWMRLIQHEALIAPFVKLNPSILLVNLNHEQIGSPISRKLILPQTEFAKSEVHHLVWTKYFAEALQACGVHERKISISGNARLDTLSKPAMTRSKLASLYNLDESKDWVLFAETRSSAYCPSSSYQQEQFECGITVSEIERYKEIQIGSLERMLEQLRMLDSSFFEKYEFIYRLHPGQALTYKIDSRIKTISSLPIGEWLHACQIYLTWSSTSAFEASVVGIPVIIHEPEAYESKYKICGLGEFETIRSIKDILNFDLSNLALRQREAAIHERYLGKAGLNASLSIARIVLNLLKTQDKRQTWPLDNSSIRHKKIAFENGTRFMVRSGLFPYLKYPHSAYAEKQDIPYIKNNLIR